MAIINLRRQHSVGQGFFHSGEIRFNGGLELSYVYDCGAMHRYSTSRHREIRAYLKHRGAKANLDVLFLSHVHADHVNGVPQLLDTKKGVRVDTIVLPLINVEERLIAFARTATEDHASAQDDFYRDFIVDPAGALNRFEPRQIVFVRSSGPDGGAPDGGEPPLDRPLGPDVFGRESEERKIPWKLVGRGVVEPYGVSTQVDRKGAQSLTVPDSVAMSVTDSQLTWLLAPYIDPGITTQHRKFLAALANELGRISLKDLNKRLTITSEIEKIVTTELNCLKAAYGVVTKDLNITSLCLYSGPARYNPSGAKKVIVGKFGCVGHSNIGRIAWLATGDAALKEVSRRRSFTRHYGKLLDEVATMTLPHHGSDHNFDPDLLNRVQARVYVASADRFSTWKHPGPHAIQSICSFPAVLQVVTSKPPSRASEQADLR